MKEKENKVKQGETKSTEKAAERKTRTKGNQEMD